MKKQRVAILFRPENRKAGSWARRLEKHIGERHPQAVITSDRPQFVVALGGDGTILEAARFYRAASPIIVGLNLGNIGFLASARRPKDFIVTINRLLQGDFITANRMLLRGEVARKGSVVFAVDALNDIALQGLLGVIKLTVSIDRHPLQYIHGNGVIIATPTGSTAYNLSAHGPIITPDIHCFVVTEILDHNIPTPSIVVKRTKIITIDVVEVRKRKVLSLSKTGEPVDAILAADDMDPFPLEEGDRVTISRSPHTVKFAEFEEGYFLKSLQEKFAFR